MNLRQYFDLYCTIEVLVDMVFMICVHVFSITNRVILFSWTNCCCHNINVKCIMSFDNVKLKFETDA